MSQFSDNFSIMDIITGVQRQKYETLQEYVDALNKNQSNVNGGIAGAYTKYKIFKYKRNGKEMEGYQEISGAFYGDGKETVVYHDENGLNISDQIKKIGDSFYYVPTIPELWFNYWPVIVAVLVAVVLLILKIRKH